ncbi:MAG: hypothetical protein Q8K32_08985 [Archangium sp.]|nr:hypothetical protein [Archangium sp.]
MNRSVSRLACGVLTLVLTACPLEQAPPPNAMSSFKVTVLGVFERVGNTRTALPVVAPCVLRYGSQAAVPQEAKGKEDCRYVIPRGEAEFDVEAHAVAIDGQPYDDFNGSVSFRVVPGDLPNNLRARWSLAELGQVKATVRAVSPYGEARVWVEDAPPRNIYDGGVVAQEELPPEPVAPLKRTFASGTSDPIYFADQTLQSIQMPGELDNRGSPFSGNFVMVGKNAGSVPLQQNCADDPARNGRDSLMVITGLDPAGFFVTDISACRVVEQLSDNAGASVRAANVEPPEPCWLTAADGGREENLDGGPGRCNISERACTRRSQCPGYSPGTFASIFVYNYNFPDNLDEGDLLFTLSGGIQEFTSTTQLVFPSWTTAERVRRLPEDQWDKWLQYARPYDITGRTCGQDNVEDIYFADALCGQNRRNLKLESLESGLVRLRRVRFPKRFQNCDFNANGSVPFFCDNAQGRVWDTCSFDAPEPEADRIERTCHHDCVVGLGENAGTICSEQATFRGFGQYVVEMAAPGPSALGLDDSLPQRVKTAVARLYVPPPVRDAGMPDAGTGDAGEADGGETDGGEVDGGVDAGIDAGVPQNPSTRLTAFFPGVQVAVTCDQPAHYRVGGSNVVASAADAVIAPGQIVRVTFDSANSAIAFQAISAQATCTVGQSARTRINLMTRDAVPELEPDCNEADPDEERAKQCQYLRGAEFDVIGHLRQAQPARPRWIVLPRAPDDLCCYPGPGLQCPRPIQPCP